MGTWLNRDAILKARDLRTEEVHVPEWEDPETGADTVLVRGLTGRERDEYEVSILVRHGGEMIQDFANARAKLVARCVVDEDGERLFTDSDVTALGEKSGAAIDRIFAVVSRLSGLRPEDVAEMTQNFGAADGSASSTPSPPASAKRPRNSSTRRAVVN